MKTLFGFWEGILIEEGGGECAAAGGKSAVVVVVGIPMLNVEKL